MITTDDMGYKFVVYVYSEVDGQQKITQYVSMFKCGHLCYGYNDRCCRCAGPIRPLKSCDVCVQDYLPPRLV